MTDTTTRKIKFEEKYNEVIIKIQNIIGNVDFLPDIKSIDSVDIYFLFTFYFQNSNENNYVNLINDLLELKKIKLSIENLNLLYPINHLSNLHNYFRLNFGNKM